MKNFRDGGDNDDQARIDKLRESLTEELDAKEERKNDREKFQENYNQKDVDALKENDPEKYERMQAANRMATREEIDEAAGGPTCWDDMSTKDKLEMQRTNPDRANALLQDYKDRNPYGSPPETPHETEMMYNNMSVSKAERDKNDGIPEDMLESKNPYEEFRPPEQQENTEQAKVVNPERTGNAEENVGLTDTPKVEDENPNPSKDIKPVKEENLEENVKLDPNAKVDDGKKTETSKPEGDEKKVDDGKRTETPKPEGDEKKVDDGKKTETPKKEGDEKKVDDGKKTETPKPEGDEKKVDDGKKTETPKTEGDEKKVDDGKKTETPKKEGDEKKDDDGKKSETSKTEDDEKKVDDGKKTETPKKEGDEKKDDDGKKTETTYNPDDPDDTDWENTSLTNEQKAIMQEMYDNGEIDSITFTDEEPEDKDPRLPTEKTGTFEGERGNSAFYPNREDAKAAMAEYGQDHVDYKDGYPDFKPFTEHDSPWGKVGCEVDIPHMTDQRTNPPLEDGSTRPKGTSHDPHYDLGNYAQADNELAAKIKDQYPDSDVTPEAVAKWREDNHLTWHETEDGKTMQLIPTSIHSACPHSGGVAESKERMAWGNYDPDA